MCHIMVVGDNYYKGQIHMYNGLEYKNRVIVGLIIIFALLFFCTGFGLFQATLPVLTLKVDNVTLREDAQMPELRVYAEFDGQDDIVLDEETGYTVGELLAEINSGSGYEFAHAVNIAREGEYPLSLDWSQDMKSKLVTKWHYKVRCQIEEGTFTVLNKYGDWEGEKFKLLDGTYASGWRNFHEDTYYFGEDEKRVTGTQVISGNTYYFQADGKFDNTKNKVNPNRPMVALTFDDGPGPFTMELLELLEQHESRASFFMVGYNVKKYPDVIRKMKDMGCEIGNHSTNHKRLGGQAAPVISAEIQTTQNYLTEILGHGATLFRPPYGSADAVVQATAKLPLAMWSIDPRDWESKNPIAIRDHIMKQVKDGDVILLHDIHETTIQAMKEVIPMLKQRGYQMVTMSEMAAARGMQMQNGGKYYNFYK